MNRKEIDLLLSRIEGLKSFLENNSLENFQQEILNVENYLKRFGSLVELLSQPNGKNIFILRDDLNRWIKRNPCFSNAEIERQANVIAYTLGQKSKNKPTKGGKK